MDSKVLFIILGVLLDGLAGLSGGILPQAFVQRHIVSLLAFAAGTLVSTAFLDLLPDAINSGAPVSHIMLATLSGFFAFYVVESFLGSHAAGQSGHKHSTVGPLILVGDAIHNATDGVAIAAAFMADTKTGFIATLAVIVHELPQEIGDYAILVANGYTRRRALFWLVLVQFSALIGAFFALWASRLAMTATPILIAASAGGFLYIASADLLPALHRQSTQAGPVTKLGAFVSGIAAIMALEYLLK